MLGDGGARLAREHQIDRIFGQDGDQGEDRQRQPGRDVQLGRFCRPREQECRSDDGEAEERCFHRVVEVAACHPEDDTGHRDGDGPRQVGLLPARTYRFRLQLDACHPQILGTSPGGNIPAESGLLQQERCIITGSPRPVGAESVRAKNYEGRTQS